jgi:predicted ATP-dependent endonuclease of OLD family
MKIAAVTVRGFRALRDVTVRVDDLTILLGSNSAGKSTLLKALKFFFEGDPLDMNDVYGRDPSGTVSVQVTFTDLTDADREAFGVYASGTQMVLSRTWQAGDMRLTGRGLRFSDFDPIRAAPSGREKTRLYRELVRTREELGLPDATRMDVVDAEMLAWEMEHPERCETVEQDSSRLFGYSSVGQSLIGQRFKFVFVPGIQDAAEEAIERKGSILERLLAAIAAQRAQANEELAKLEEKTREEYGEVVERAHGPTLRGLAESLQSHMRRYVPSAGISLAPVAPQLSVAPPRVELQGGEERDLSDLGRQGHGFQRTFIIAALEYLAEAALEDEPAGEDRPTLFLAIEEPELYQHPPRARHFFETLRRLASAGANVQVAYATHSPYFVSAENLDNLRVFRRTPTDAGPAGVGVSQATLADVQGRLSHIAQHIVERHIARTVAGSFAESFFARAVLLVEGPTDAAVFVQAARMLDRDLAPLGVVCATVSKSAMPAAKTALEEFGIPTYVVFDADGHTTDQEQCDICGRGETQRRASAEATNRQLLTALGEGSDQPFPTTGIRGSWACFSDDLEHFLHESSEGFTTRSNEAAIAHGWKPKSPEAYGEALERGGVDAIPEMIVDVINRVIELAASSRSNEEEALS